mgnify:CR=1 FL=1
MKNIIIERLNCNVKTAEKLETKLNVISDELKPILNAWLESGLETSDIEYNGYSINSLMKKDGMKFTGALLTLDWLIRDPKKASAVIEKGIM